MKFAAKCPNKIRNAQAGLSMVEVLVTMAIMIVIIATTASLFAAQQKEIRSLHQKAESIELKNLLLKTLGNPSYCEFHIKEQVVDITGVTTTAMSPTTILLPKIFHGDPTTTAPIVEANQPLFLSSHGLVVDKLSFKNIFATGNPDEYQGTWEVEFRASSMALPMKPIQLHQVFKIATVAGVSKVSSCIGSNTTLGQMIQSSCVERKAATVRKEECGIVALAQCAPDELAIVGGSIMGQNTATQSSNGIYDATGVMTSWEVIWYGTHGNCPALNAAAANGTIAPGTAPCFGTFCGSSSVFCCKK